MADAQTIWLTRPLADSTLLATELAEHGIRTLVAPIMHISSKPFDVPATLPDALLITSRHASTALAQLPSSWHALPVYCVGNATASMARELGFSHVIPGGQDVLSILPHLLANASSLSTLLYLSGEDITLDVAPRLAQHNIHVQRVVVYEASPIAVLGQDICSGLNDGSISGVTFFSTRTAQICNSLLTQAGLKASARKIDAYCLSLNVAGAAGGLPWARLITCHSHTRHAMRDLIVSHAKNS
jgi:uroporphyrinogen-III synthase